MAIRVLLSFALFFGSAALADCNPFTGVCTLTSAPAGTAARSTTTLDGVIGNLRTAEATQVARLRQLEDASRRITARLDDIDRDNNAIVARRNQLLNSEDPTAASQIAELDRRLAGNNRDKEQLGNDLQKNTDDRGQISLQLEETRRNLAAQQATRSAMASPGGGCGGGAGGGCGRGGHGSGGGKGGGGGGGGNKALMALAIGGAAAGLAVALATSGGGGGDDGASAARAAEAEKKRQDDALKAAEDEANKVAAKDAELRAEATKVKDDPKNRADITALLDKLYKDVKPSAPAAAAPTLAQNNFPQPRPQVGVVDLRVAQCFRMPGRVTVACRAGTAQLCYNGAGQPMPCP